MSTFLPRFRLSIIPAPVATGVPEAAPLELCLDLGITRQAGSQPPDSANTPETSRGSFNHDRESGIYPLQWGNLARRMGAKKAPRRQCLPEERGLTERSIGAVKGKRKRLHNDPYAGGKRSGKRAKSDALSQAANASTRGHVPPNAPPQRASSTRPPSPHMPSPFAFDR
jgi:hypothetical protein